MSLIETQDIVDKPCKIIRGEGKGREIGVEYVELCKASKGLCTLFFRS